MAGLTTTEAPFIEESRLRGELYIQQPYHLYSEANQIAWRELMKRMVPRWEKYSNPMFQKGVERLCLDPNCIPKLEDVNKFLEPLSGFKAKAVSGYVPAFIFFDCLRQKEFPTTITIRKPELLDYLPEPDIFHDIAGHVPMHTDRTFADVLVKFGECALSAARIASKTKDLSKRRAELSSMIQAMARFFWFTIEFGLMKSTTSDSKLCAYGSGLLSSYGELKHCIESTEVQRYPIQLEWVVNQSFEIDHYQPLLFVVDSFDHLFFLVDELEKMIFNGKLKNVAPGEPGVSEADLKSFLEAKL